MPLNFVKKEKNNQQDMTRVILVAGLPKSGKTTLITSIYEGFQKKFFSTYLFAGSRTLLQFEELCFPSRITSLNISPETIETERSSHNQQSYLHCKICSIKNTQSKYNLYFTDLPGELFDILKYKPTKKVNEINEQLRIADRFVFLFDCEKFDNLKIRNQAFSSGKIIIDECLKTGLLGENPYIDIVFSKYDIIQSMQPGQQVIFKQSIKDQTNALLEQFKNKCIMNFFEISVRDTLDYEHESNLEKLFKEWVENKRKHIAKHTAKKKPIPNKFPKKRKKTNRAKKKKKNVHKALYTR